MRRAICVASLAALLGLAGCAPAESPSAASLGSEPPATTPTSKPPIDASITAVSLSHPSAAAREAIDLCNAGQYGLDKIAGWGQLTTARDAVHYAPLTGLEPETKVDRPAFVIQFKGQIPQPSYDGEIWVDPICVVIDGAPGFFATGPRILAGGAAVTPLPALLPDRSLPSPAP